VPPENFSKRIQELSSLLSEVVYCYLGVLISGAASLGNALVFTAVAVPVTCTHFISRRGDIHFKNTSRTALVGRSWNWQDNVDGHVFQ
jgi:hypothetical protein